MNARRQRHRRSFSTAAAALCSSSSTHRRLSCPLTASPRRMPARLWPLRRGGSGAPLREKGVIEPELTLVHAMFRWMSFLHHRPPLSLPLLKASPLPLEVTGRSASSWRARQGASLVLERQLKGPTSLSNRPQRPSNSAPGHRIEHGCPTAHRRLLARLEVELLPRHRLRARPEVEIPPRHRLCAWTASSSPMSLSLRSVGARAQPVLELPPAAPGQRSIFPRRRLRADWSSSSTASSSPSLSGH